LRKVKPGDRVLFYHTGKEKAVVGEMRVVTAPRPDASGDAKQVVLDVEFVRHWPRPVFLAQIKDDSQLTDWDLVRLPRLSVVPMRKTQWNRVRELAKRSVERS
jgi:predicted RNA-binding protein with PUA-like domain